MLAQSCGAGAQGEPLILVILDLARSCPANVQSRVVSPLPHPLRMPVSSLCVLETQCLT